MWATDGDDDEAMIGNGTSSGFSVISARSQSGALPPGVGSTMIARPSQTNDMPRVTTIEGSWRSGSARRRAP